MASSFWSPLYDAVALGMYSYGRAAFNVRVVTPPGETLDANTLYLAAHREESDVPIICGNYYTSAHVWRQRWPRLHFAARDDLFQKGFFAGFPPGLPRHVRRALHPLAIGRFLDYVRVHPISSAVTMKLGQALEMVDSDMPLEEALSPELYEGIQARAGELGVPTPSAVAEVDGGDYADLLWQNVEAADLPAAPYEEAWARRATNATADLRTIVGLVKAGEPLLLFPEGRPSPDGGLGPLRRGLGAVIRRGKPAELRAFGLAYDPLSTGRAGVVMTVMPGIETPTGSGEPDVLPYLASAIALTCGQVVATELLRAADEGRHTLAPVVLDHALITAREAALAAGRVVDPLLEEQQTRRRALERALRAAERRGLLEIANLRAIELDAEALGSDPILARLANEQASVVREIARGAEAGAAPSRV
jgi:hypothetical protein